MPSDLRHSQLRRGRQLLQLGRWPEAEQCFRTVLGGNPDDGESLCLLACSLDRQPGRRREALAVIDRAVAADPEVADTHVLRAEILRGLDCFGESLAAARRAAACDPDHIGAWCQQAHVLLRLDRRAEAEQAARTAMNLDADHPMARTVMAMALDAAVRTSENLTLLRQSLRDDPMDAETHAAMGRALLQRGAAAEAESHFAEALRLEPGDLFARNGLLEALRARSCFYRWYLRLYFAIERRRRHFPGSRFLTFCGLGHLPGGMLHGTATFFLLFSPRVRRLLLASEKLDAVMTGVPVLVTAAALLAGICGAGPDAWKTALTAGFLSFAAGARLAEELPDRLRSDVTVQRRD